MEEALNKFIEYWKAKKNVIGILITGSYALDSENKNSDIDIRIIYNKNQEKTTKGLTTIDGYIFSYLGRNIETTKRRMSTDFLNRNKLEVGMFSIGKILYDKDNELKKIIKISKTYLATPFIQKKISKEEIYMRMYTLYTYKNFLESSEKDSPYFSYIYYIFMKMAFSSYSSFLGQEIFIDTKIEKVLSDKQYRLRNNWVDFPDNKFVKLWTKCIEHKNINTTSSKMIFDYLQKKMMKFNENDIKMTWLEL